MVFPRSNLPNDSVPWGRQVQNEIEELKRIYGSVEEDVLSDNRAFAGQLGVLSQNMLEVVTQSSEVINVPDKLLPLHVPGNGEFRDAEDSVIVNIPPPVDGSLRPPIVQFFANIYSTSNQPDYYYDWVYIDAFGLGQRGHFSYPPGAPIPPWGGDDVVLIKTLPPGTFNVEIKVYGRIDSWFGGPSVDGVVGFRNGTLSVMYGGI